MWSPKSIEDRPFSTFSQSKILKFYHSSTSRHHENPPLFKSRLLTSQTHNRASTLLSPNRIQSKSIVVSQHERPLTTAIKRQKHPKSGVDIMNSSEIKSLVRKTQMSRKDPSTLQNLAINCSNLSISEERNKLLSAYGSNSIRNPCSYEEIVTKLRLKQEQIQKKRENLKKELAFNKYYEKSDIDRDVKVFLSVLAGHHERNLERFLLLSEVETDNFEKFLDLEDFILKIIGLFYESFRGIAEELTTLKIKSQEQESLYFSLRQNNNEFLKREIDKLTEQNRKDFHRLKLNINKFDSLSSFENIRLEKELVELQKGLEARFDIEEISEEFENFKLQSRNQIQQKDFKLNSKEQLINKYIYQLTTLKGALMKSERDNKLFLKENNDLKSEINKLKHEISGLNEKKRVFREISMMQKEECEGYIERNSRLLKTINLLSDRLLETKKKIGRNVENIGLLSNIDNYMKDFEMANEVSGLMGQKFARTLARSNFTNEDFENLQRESMNFMQESPHKSSFGMNQRTSEFEDVLGQINLRQLQYFKPSFLSFLEKEEKNKRKSTEDGLETKISLHFLATLRGILDSKYNEFLHFNDYRSFSKFPDFVYSWLTNFEISDENKQIKEIGVEKSANPNEILVFFIKSLYHPLGLKLWECQNFKDFFEEKSSQDELFFFLHCRFLLNKGPTLNKDGAAFSYVHYTLFYYAESIVDLVLKHFDEETKSFIKARLREKAKGKNKKLLIDVSFVLKILLEYYRLERKQKFINIRDIIRVLSVKKSNYGGSPMLRKNAMISDFSSFKLLMEKISVKTTELEKAEFYRECFQIGSGEITPEVVFSVLSESGFFIKTLKLKSLMNLTTTNKSKEPRNKEFYARKLEFFNEKIKENEKLKSFFTKLKKELCGLGLERTNELFEFNVRLFSEKYKFIDLAEFCGKSPELILGKLGTLINEFRSLKIFNAHFFEEEKNEREWEVFEWNVVAFEERHNEEKIRGFEKNTKIKKLQGFMRKRASKWYVLINSLLNRIKQKS